MQPDRQTKSLNKWESRGRECDCRSALSRSCADQSDRIGRTYPYLFFDRLFQTLWIYLLRCKIRLTFMLTSGLLVRDRFGCTSCILVELIMPASAKIVISVWSCQCSWAVWGLLQMVLGSPPCEVFFLKDTIRAIMPQLAVSLILYSCLSKDGMSVSRSVINWSLAPRRNSTVSGWHMPRRSWSKVSTRQWDGFDIKVCPTHW